MPVTPADAEQESFRQAREDGEQDGGPESPGRPPGDHRTGRDADASADAISRSTSSG